MSTISSYEKQFKEANKRLTIRQKELVSVEEQMETLKRKQKELQQQIKEDEQNKVVKGMLYYSESRRNTLLNRAEELQFSKSTLIRLRSYENDNWNADTIDAGVIADFETIEEYVKTNKASWENSLLAIIGNQFVKKE